MMENEEKDELDLRDKNVAPVPTGSVTRIPGWQQQTRDYYKGREFADDDELTMAADEMIQELIEYQQAGKEANAKLIEVFQSEPDVAAFMTDVIKGASIPEALARNFDLDSITPTEGGPDFGQWEAASKERVSKMESRTKHEEELMANKIESSGTFAGFEQEKGMTTEEADAFIDKIETFLGDIYKGRVSKEFLDAMYKAIDYESALSSARNEAALQAKNEKVVLAKKTYDKPKGDGLPEIRPTGGAVEQPTGERPRFLKSLDEYAEREKRRI